MGCVSSTFLEDDDRRIISASHVVSLTSSTYGILTTINGAAHAHADDDPRSPPPPPPPLPPPPLSRSAPPDADAQPEVINSWELMAGLHDPSTPAKSKSPRSTCSSRVDKDARDGRPPRSIRFPLRPLDGNTRPPPPPPTTTRQQEQQQAAVLYTTTLRGVRSTFEACNAVRAALQSHGVAFRERDVSMDRGFREELRGLLLSATARGGGIIRVPRLFVRGRDVGGAEEVARLEEEGALGRVLEGLPRARAVSAGGGCCCDGCGGMRFLPCFECSGSRKVVVVLAGGGGVDGKTKRGGGVVVRCGECNENGLVLCPICS